MITKTSLVIGWSILFCIFVIAGYGIIKTTGYRIFYEDNVKETIREMVKPEYLK